MRIVRGRPDAVAAVPRHPLAGHRGRRAGAALARLRARLRDARAASTSTTPTDRRPADRRVPRAATPTTRTRARRGSCCACPTPESNHNGGLLLFGPDGHMYVGTGDGGGGGDRHGPRGNAQNLGSCSGRSCGSTRGASGGRPYSRPGRRTRSWARAGARGEIYAYGLRNPWRFSFDRRTGDLVIGDVGQNAWEEIDFKPRGKARGANFGWRAFEGRSRYTPGESAPGARRAGHRQRSHADGSCSITGGVVVRDRALRGAARALRVRRLLQRADRSRRSCRRGGRAACGARRCTCRASPRSARTRAGTSTSSRSNGPGLPHRPALSAVDDIALRPRGEPRRPHARRDEHVDRRARPRVGRRPGAGADGAPRRGRGRGGGARRRGGIALTHDHPDHAEGVAALRERLGGRAGRGDAASATSRSATATRSGPLRALHVARPRGRPPRLRAPAGVAFTGDAVLGEGSVFIAPDGGSLGGYLDGLRRLRALGLERLCPGHGPVVEDPAAKLDEYVAHRLERERADRRGARRRRAHARTSCSTPPGTTHPGRPARLRGALDAPRPPREAGARGATRASDAFVVRRREWRPARDCSAAASGVTPSRSAGSSTVRSVSPIARTRLARAAGS